MSGKYCSVNILYEAVLTVHKRSCSCELFKDMMTCRIWNYLLLFYFIIFTTFSTCIICTCQNWFCREIKKLIKDIMTLIKSTPSLTTIQQHSSLLSYYTFIHMQNTFHGFQPHVLWVQPVCYPRLYKTPSCHLPNSITHIHHPFICRRSNANERFL